MVSLNSIDDVEHWIQSVTARGMKPWSDALPDRLAARIGQWEISTSYDRDAEYFIDAWCISGHAKATVAPWVVDELAAKALEVER